ncbi:MAG: Membrane protein insertase, YidC/Oxa1 family [Parcubacteria group bacterium GW2011_GWA2_47_26]|nr:MAG: Membrane protein insertase, YidC/Oxa1 family [Parcubacteria group bacterium GW2011_GWA2_47_26]
MIYLYNAIFLKPVFNALIGLYNVVGDMGLAILLLTIGTRLLILPVTLQTLRSQKALQDLQPKINALKEKYKGDRQGLAKATMELYKTEKVNPASSCLPMLIQLPIFIALYQALTVGLKSEGMHLLYGFVNNPGTISSLAFGFFDLAKANFVVAVLAGLSQFWQTAMLSRHKPKNKIPGSKDEAMLGMMNKQMLYVMPAFTVVIGASLPAGVILYWLVTNLLTIIQQYVFLRPKLKAISVATVIEGSKPEIREK